MTTNIDALVAAASASNAALVAVKADNKATAEAAFIQSAKDTWAVVKASPRGGAARLAAVNKDAGVKGYTSEAGIGYHAVTGFILTLPEGEVGEDGLPTAPAIQSLVRKVGTKPAREIAKAAKTQAKAVLALKAAVEPDSVEDILKITARKATDAAAAFVGQGDEATLSDKARSLIDDIVLALNTLLEPEQVVVVTVPADASSLVPVAA